MSNKILIILSIFLFIFDAGSLLLLEATVGLLAVLVLKDLALLALVYWLIQQSISSPIKNLEQQLDKLATAEAINFGNHFETSNSGVLTTALTKLNVLFDKTDNSIGWIASSSSRLLPMSNELQDTYGSMTQKAVMQANHGEVLSNSMQQMREATDKVTSEIDSITDSMHQADDNVAAASNDIQSTVSSIHTLSQQITEATDHISTLKEDSEKINDIISVINGIAEQTNLLALNAAIEAARAGEQGRGFAVVADEVRSLAERTSNSTLEVREMVDKIQQGTERVFTSMEQGRIATKETVTRSEHSRQQLKSINQAVAEITAVSDRIKDAAHDQLNIAAEAQTSVDAMVTLNSEALENTQIQGVSAKDLKALGDRLHTLLQVFAVNEKLWDTDVREKDLNHIEQNTNISANDEVELF